MTESAQLADGESVTYFPPDNALSGPPDLRFVHYNDVYHVEPGSQEPVGGIARFKTLCDYYQHDARFENQPGCLTMFSGDAFNPSLESSVTKGKHMVPALNALNTSVACLGNHDLDFGVEQFEHLAAMCRFPWLCANVLDPDLGPDTPLGRCQKSVMLTASNGIKIGVIGLVEREWLDTINSLPPHIIFQEPDAVVAELAPKLRAEGAEMLIALTHQRQPNDEKLARGLEPGTVDIILSGHDHYYAHSTINGTHILRSGTDFKQLSYLECRRQRRDRVGSGWEFRITRRDVISSIPSNSDAVKMTERMSALLRPKLEKPVGYTAVPLDARFTTVRLKESNLGNFVCDLMRLHYSADCCIMAAGTVRGDQVYPPGVIKVKDIMDCFPFEDPCVVVGVSGQSIVDALENAVSKYPALEGRFPQVSGITFSFAPSRPPGQRCFDICINNSPVDPDKEYTMATRDYMVRGKDGFTSLVLEEDGGKAKSIVGDESGMLISMLLRQYFMSLKVLGKWKKWGAHLGRHWGEIQEDLHGVHPVREPLQAGSASVQENAQPEQPGRDISSLIDETHKHRRSPHRAASEQEQILHSDSEDDTHIDLSAATDARTHSAPRDAAKLDEWELRLMRKVTRKWWRLTGLKGHPAMCDAVDEEIGVPWTKGICPRLEGRIRIVDDVGDGGSEGR